MTLPNHGPRPGQKDDISLVKYKSVIKLFVAATVGCQGAKNRVFASFCSGIHRKHPTHALQHTAGTTPLSGTPCEFTGRVWEVACCSGKPKWAQDHRQNGGQQQERHLDATGGHFRDEGAPSWLVLVCGGWRGVGKSVGSHWGSRGYERRVFASVEPVQERHLDGTWTQLGALPWGEGT